MGTDVGRQTDLHEEPMSDRQSLSSNYRYCSQSRKMSVGILVDSVSNAKVQEPGAQTAEIERCGQKNSVRCREGHSPRVEKHLIVEPKDASPWVSTRSFKPKLLPHSVADLDTECTPSLPAASVNFFAAKSGLGSDVCKQRNSGRAYCSVEEWNVNNAEQVENPVCSIEQGVQQEKEQVQNNDKTTETGGRESLRIKLWEILGDVSSPNKQHPSLQREVLHPDQERNNKQCPTEKLSLSSDTIESDSQAQVSTRPMTRSLARRKATRKQGNKSEPTKSNDRKECQRKRIFSSKGDISVGSYGKLMDGSLPCKGEKFMGMSSQAETNQGVRHKNVEKRQQSEKSKSIPAVDKLMLHKNKVSNASSSTDRRNDVHVETEKVSLNAMTDQRDVQQPMVVEAPKKNLQEDICNSVLKRKRNSPQLQKGFKNNFSFEIPLNAMTDQRDVQQSMDVEASKNFLQEDMSDFMLKRKRNSLQPKSVTRNNSSFELLLNSMTDKRDVEQSMDVEASKKNLEEDISDSLLLKKRNTVQPQKDTKNNSSFEFPLHSVTDQRDLELSMGVEASGKNMKEGISDILLKKKKNTVHNTSTPPSEIKSHSSLQKSKQEELHDQSPAAKIFHRTSMQNFKSFLSSESAKRGPDLQQEPSVGKSKNKEDNSLKRGPLVKPNVLIDEDSDNQSKSLIDETDSESSEDESNCKESEELSPENHISENILHNSDKSLGNGKDVGVIGSSQASDSLKEGVHDANEMYMEENQEDGLTRAVALFTVALSRIKTKLKSISSRRSADILRATVEEILLRLQNAESLIKTDVGKLTNLSNSKSKQLETRFQEKQEQLIGIHKRFKAEVEQHLQECGSLIANLEEHEIELKRSMEKQRAAHKKFLSQVEQETNVQLEDAESRIMAVQEVAREKMLQLKLGVAECLKHGGLS
ncbi:meiosis-specific protein ASY3-like [Salvia splendens]|uniref:meiosis-specific protein ASY3-like n=1 Tax=Salvia splendens TaxID=180675 RepID=UPI001C2808F5|nr:meiosis-specific protein ASY3-like [Salvia splendens]